MARGRRVSSEVFVTGACIEAISRNCIWAVLPPVSSYRAEPTVESEAVGWKTTLALHITRAGLIVYMLSFQKLT